MDRRQQEIARRRAMNRRRKRRIMKRRRNIFKGIVALGIGIIITSTFLNRDNKDIEDNIEPREVNEIEKLEEFVVTIDAGHGDWDAGTVSPKDTLEKDVNLAVSLKIGEILDDVEGVSVIYTRDNDDLTGWPDDVIPNLDKRVEISNKYDSDVFISIHCNSGTDTSYSGVETWYNPEFIEATEIAHLIQANLVSIGYTNDRGAKESVGSHSLAVLRNNPSAAVLLELGFLTNSNDEAYLISDFGQTKIAEAIAQAVVEYKIESETIEEEVIEGETSDGTIPEGEVIE